MKNILLLTVLLALTACERKTSDDVTKNSKIGSAHV